MSTASDAGGSSAERAVEKALEHFPINPLIRDAAQAIEECQALLGPEVRLAILEYMDSVGIEVTMNFLTHYVGMMMAVVFSSGKLDLPANEAKMPVPGFLLHNPIYRAISRLETGDVDPDLRPRHQELLEKYQGGLDFAELVFEEALRLKAAGEDGALDLVAHLYAFVALELASSGDVIPTRLTLLQQQLGEVQR